MAVIDPTLRIRSVALGVSDLPRSVDFYERVLGLALIARDGSTAQLGPEAARPALALTGIADPAIAAPGSTGLFHVAWLHPTRAALAATVRRILGAGWRIDGASDHGVSEALYLSDPDGLGIEIYADRPRERWRRPADGHGVSMVTLPLDIEDLLAQDERPPPPAIAAGTAVGHVHMKVADVARASAFYRDALGFEEQAEMPAAAFLAAGGYHHHVGLNSWQSSGGASAPEHAPGLRLIDFELGDSAAIDALERTLAESPAGAATREDEDTLALRDPDGQLLSFGHR